MSSYGHGHVVRECIHVNTAFLKILQILLSDIQFDIVLIPELLRISRIVAKTLHIATIEDALFPLVAVEQDILGILGMRIIGDAADHAADHIVGIDLMADLDGLGRSDKLIVQMLVGILEVLIRHIVRQEVDRIVDLVESQPVFDQPLKFRKTGLCELDEQGDQFPILPVTQRLFQIQRRIEMPDRD